MAKKYHYEKWDAEKGQLKGVWENFVNDADGKITGQIVMNVFSWFDENPEERIRLGWTKHYTFDKPEDAGVEYDSQTQYYVITQKQLDPYTVEDVYNVKDKSEEQLLFEEMLEVANGNVMTVDNAVGGFGFI